MIFSLGGLVAFFAALCLYTRLEIHGRQVHPISIRALVIIHRVSGYLFGLSYLALMALMVIRYMNYPGELPSQVSIHAVFGMTIFPLLAVKVASARYFKRIGIPFLLSLGLLLWTLAFTTYFMMLRVDKPGEIASYGDSSELFQIKCSKCHGLSRPLEIRHSREEWRGIVERMRGYDPEWIDERDVPRISDYLTSVRGKSDK